MFLDEVQNDIQENLNQDNCTPSLSEVWFKCLGNFSFLSDKLKSCIDFLDQIKNKTVVDEYLAVIQIYEKTSEVSKACDEINGSCKKYFSEIEKKMHV